MSPKTNGPRDQREPLQNKKSVTAKSTLQFDPSQCGPHCGFCWESFCGDLLCCEAELIGALRRELRDALSGETR